jgi:hypothetical protein
MVVKAVLVGFNTAIIAVIASSERKGFSHGKMCEKVTWANVNIENKQ